MCVSIYACVHLGIPVCMYISVYLYVYACVFVCMCIVYAFVYVYKCACNVLFRLHSKYKN